MTEEDVVISDIEKAKIVMGKVDPVLLSAALSEMMIEADKAEEADDVARVKKAIKGVYDSIPEGKDKASIMSKAIAEFDADVVDKEIAIIKEKLAGIALETLMDAATNYVGGRGIIHDPKKLRSYFTCAIYRVYGDSCTSNVCKGSDLVLGDPYILCKSDCILFGLKAGCVTLIKGEEYCAAGIGIDFDLDVLEERITQNVIQRPELSRALKKMVDQMKK